jgi:DNA repair protein RecO (recombination protein O)
MQPVRHTKATAVILHTSDVFDADRSYLLFAREQGKLRARAKGVRKPKSRLAGNLLPYVPVELEFITGDSGWELIVQAHGLVSGGYPNHPLTFLQHAELIAETIDKLLPDREAMERLRALCTDETDSPTLLLVVAELLFKILIVMGYRPELENCVVTGEELTPQGLSWSSQVGGVVSEKGLRNMSVPALPLKSARSVVALRQLARPEFVAERLNMDADVQAETCKVVFDYLQTQIGKPLKSYGVLGRF